MNWIETLKNLRSSGGKLAASNPAVIGAYRTLNEAVGKSQILDSRTRELIALAVAVTTRCDGCISSHAEAARKAGVTEEELAEALGVAIALNAGAAFVYSSRALEAFKQFGD